MIANIASPNHDLPSFPVNMQTREGSPTKGFGRRSPSHDYQMASIAEDTRGEGTTLTSHPPVATSPTVPAMHGLSNGMDIPSEGDVYCTISTRALQVHINRSTGPHPPQSQISSSNGMQGCPVQLTSDHIDVPNSINILSNSQSILNRISTVLSTNGIQHYQSNNVFVVQHDAVKLHIIYNPLQVDTIHMQFIAGDPMQYQSLSSHLAAQLQ